MTDYRRLYEAAVEHIEALNQWASTRGVTLPDTDTRGAVAQDERIGTLEDALRPFAEEGRRCSPQESVAGPLCTVHLVPAPCKYETARRALEGEG